MRKSKNFLLKMLLTLFFSCGCMPLAYSFENVFYILRSHDPAKIGLAEQAAASLTQHAALIHILISQAYQIDENGLMWGFIDPDVVSISDKKSLKLMILVTNAQFDKVKAHQFLSNPAAQKKAIESILTICKKNHYYGVQLDFEMIAQQDREALTQFYLAAADQLHQAGFVVSFAVAPLFSDTPPASDFQKKIYENWQGAYDLKALGSKADFLTVMAYNQHGDRTTPGPTASLPWVDEVIQFVLKYVPRQKVSLGIPVYSGYWFTGKDKQTQSGKIVVNLAGVRFDETKYLLRKFHGKLHWDELNKVNYATFQHDWLTEYLYVEDAHSFQAKLELAKKYQLRGISVFSMGFEDPLIWSMLQGVVAVGAEGSMQNKAL